MRLLRCVRFRVASLLISLTLVASVVYAGLVFSLGSGRSSGRNRVPAALETKESWMGWYDKSNATQPTVTGALRHYKALPDGHQVRLFLLAMEN